MYQKYIAVGRTASDFKLRFTGNGTPVANVNLAINRTDKDTIFIPCVVWNERAKEYTDVIGKGSLLFIEGEWKNYTHTKENEEKIPFWQVEIKECKILDRKNVESTVNAEEQKE